MLLRIENATKRFGGLVANENINIEVEEGTIVGLIGPNGAGKSTLFKSINGFNRINEGEIYFNDKPISKIPTHKISKLGIACTFQNAQLFAALTLEESVLLGAYCHLTNKAEALTVARKMIEYVGLAGFEQKQIKSLNMYNRKKAELAAALATQPKLLLLDEIFAGLLPTEVEMLVELVRRISSDLHITLFVVEHVLHVIMSICSKVYVLENGRLLASGTPKEVTENEEVITAYLGRDYNAASGK